MIASGLIELGYKVAGPDTGDDYDARVADAGDGAGPRIVEWKARGAQPSLAAIEAAGKAREARLAGVKPDRERLAALETEIAGLKGRIAAVEARATRA